MAHIKQLQRQKSDALLQMVYASGPDVRRTAKCGFCSNTRIHRQNKISNNPAV